MMTPYNKILGIKHDQLLKFILLSQFLLQISIRLVEINIHQIITSNH